MSQNRGKTGGLEEAKNYMHNKEIPQLFESMMTALMFKKPDDHLDFLEQCLVKAKKQDKVKWHTFIEPLPPIPRSGNKVEKEKVDDVSTNEQHAIKQTYSPLPPIATTNVNDNSIPEAGEIGNETETIAIDPSIPDKEEIIQGINDVPNSSGDSVDIINDDDDEQEVDNDVVLKAEDDDGSVQVVPPDDDTDVTPENNVEENDVNTEENKVEVDVEDANTAGEVNEDAVEAVTLVDSEDKSSDQEVNKVVETVAEDVVEAATPVDEEKSSDEVNTVGELIPEDAEDPAELATSVNEDESSGVEADAAVEVSADEVVTSTADINEANEEKSSDQVETVLAEVTKDDVAEVGTLEEKEETSTVTEVAEEDVVQVGTSHEMETSEVVDANTDAVNELIEVPEWNGDITDKEDITSQTFSKPVIFVLGGPGSGKGTQCEKIVEKYSFLHLSAGDLLRVEAKKGGEIAAIMEQGQLVPQEITIGLIKQAMLDNPESKGFLIDGFPREIEQGKTFESEVTSPKLLLNYNCPDEMLVERLLERGKHSGRVDDNEESIKKRLDLFHTKTEPVIGHYGDIVKSIDSSQSVDQVFADTCQVLEQLDCVHAVAVEEPIVPVEEDIIPGRGQISHLLGDKIKNMTFVLAVGFQGCGKKEQCSIIVQNFGYNLISADDILKAEVQTGTDRARAVSDALENGGAVPQEIIMELIGEAILNLDDNIDKVLIDGFPRNITEAERFESEIATVKFFIYFSCPFETLIDKLGSSESDKEIEEQLETFHTTVQPVLEKYKDRGMGLEISMQSSETDVSACIQKIFDESTPSEDTVLPAFYSQ